MCGNSLLFDRPPTCFCFTLTGPGNGRETFITVVPYRKISKHWKGSARKIHDYLGTLFLREMAVLLVILGTFPSNHLTAWGRGGEFLKMVLRSNLWNPSYFFAACLLVSVWRILGFPKGGGSSWHSPKLSKQLLSCICFLGEISWFLVRPLDKEAGEQVLVLCFHHWIQEVFCFLAPSLAKPPSSQTEFFSLGF